MNVVMMHNAVNGTVPEHLSSYFVQRSDTFHHEIRDSPCIALAIAALCYGTSYLWIYHKTVTFP